MEKVVSIIQSINQDLVSLKPKEGGKEPVKNKRSAKATHLPVKRRAQLSRELKRDGLGHLLL